MTERRPSGLERSPTAPSVLSNGHFASVGAEGDAASYEHGVQVIDGDKEFKYDHLPPYSYPLSPRYCLSRGPCLILIASL